MLLPEQGSQQNEIDRENRYSDQHAGTHFTGQGAAINMSVYREAPDEQDKIKRSKFALRLLDIDQAQQVNGHQSKQKPGA